MSSSYFKTEGLILRKMSFGEADFLVRILTKDFGKMDILAKSARKSSSKLNPHLDILNHVRLQFVRPARQNFNEGGNGEKIPTLTDVEVISRFDDWFSDADKLSIMGRILQVIDMVVLPGAKDETLFSMTVDFFRSQKQNQETALNFLREFFAHEGHGDSLPPEHREAIIKQWPALKS